MLSRHGAYRIFYLFHNCTSELICEFIFWIGGYFSTQINLLSPSPKYARLFSIFGYCPQPCSRQHILAHSQHKVAATSTSQPTPKLYTRHRNWRPGSFGWIWLTHSCLFHFHKASNLCLTLSRLHKIKAFQRIHCGFIGSDISLPAVP